MPPSNLQCLRKIRGEESEASTLAWRATVHKMGFRGITALKVNLSPEDASLFTPQTSFKKYKNIGESQRFPFFKVLMDQC